MLLTSKVAHIWSHWIPSLGDEMFIIHIHVNVLLLWCPLDDEVMCPEDVVAANNSGGHDDGVRRSPGVHRKHGTMLGRTSHDLPNRAQDLCSPDRLVAQ